MIADQKSNKKITGFYLIDGDSEGVKLAVTRNPNWFRRLFTWVFVGWSYKKL